MRTRLTLFLALLAVTWPGRGPAGTAGFGTLPTAAPQAPAPDVKSWLANLPVIEEFTYSAFCLTLPDYAPRTYFVRMQPGAELVVIQDGQARRIASRVTDRHVCVFFPNLKLGQLKRFDSKSSDAQDTVGAKTETESTLAEAAAGLGLGMQMPTSIAKWKGDSFVYHYGEKRWLAKITAWDKTCPAVIEYTVTFPDKPGGPPSSYHWRICYTYGGSSNVPPQFPSGILVTFRKSDQWVPIWRYNISSLRVAKVALAESAFDPMAFANYPLMEIFAENGKMFVRGNGRTEELHNVELPGTIHPEREQRSRWVYYILAGLFTLWPAYLLFMAYRRKQIEGQT